MCDPISIIIHMMRDKYINVLYPMRVYQPALYVLAKRLLPWWVDGTRVETYPLLYQNFTWLCEYAMWLESRKESTEYREIPLSSPLSSYP